MYGMAVTDPSGKCGRISRLWIAGSADCGGFLCVPEFQICMDGAVDIHDTAQYRDLSGPDDPCFYVRPGMGFHYAGICGGSVAVYMALSGRKEGEKQGTAVWLLCILSPSYAGFISGASLLFVAKGQKISCHCLEGVDNDSFSIGSVWKGRHCTEPENRIIV